MSHKSLSATNLFFAMLSGVTVGVKGLDQNYWAFILNYPIKLEIRWGDINIKLIFLVTRSIDNRGLSQPVEKGRVINTYIVGVQGIPICMGNGVLCLEITFQVWLSMINTTQNYLIKFYMLHAPGLKGRGIRDTSAINLMFC